MMSLRTELEIPPLAHRRVNNELMDDISPAIGHVVIAFALIDMVLDFWLIECFPRAVKANVASKMPYKLGDKVALLQKCFSRIGSLKPMAPEALKLLDTVGAMNRVRNTLAHAALSHTIEAPDSVLVFAKLGYEKAKGVHLYTDRTLSFREITAVAEDAREVLADMHSIAIQLRELGATG